MRADLGRSLKNTEYLFVGLKALKSLNSLNLNIQSNQLGEEPENMQVLAESLSTFV